MQRGLRVIILQGVIAIAILENEWLNGTIIISNFGSSNNIFADCITKEQRARGKTSVKDREK